MWIVNVISIYCSGQQSYCTTFRLAGTPRNKEDMDPIKHYTVFAKNGRRVRKPTTCYFLSCIRGHGEYQYREEGKHEAGYNQVKNVVELSAPDFDGKCNIDILLWATVVLYNIPRGRDTCKDRTPGYSHSLSPAHAQCCLYAQVIHAQTEAGRETLVSTLVCDENLPF